MGPSQEPGKHIARYADEAMYRAEHTIPDPKVTLIDMTRRPLQVVAAAAETYRGGVFRDPRDISRPQAMEWLEGFKDSKISAPMEWVNLSFYIEGVTRSFTHQMVRQRTATFVQESLRFAVKEDAALEVMDPPSLQDKPYDHPWRLTWRAAVDYAAQAYNRLVDNGMPAEDARGLLPHNITTRIHYHTDLRNFYDLAGMRLCSQAQYEWKMVWNEFIKAILTYGPTEDRWQQQAIAQLFKPVCYQTGHCGFNGPADRWCVIRDRVNAHAEAGDRPEDWIDIDPREPLHHAAARKAR